MMEEVKIWARDFVDCIKELMGNMTFQGHMSYAHEKVTHHDMQKYSEMCTSEWWWKMQVHAS
ncbi:uncharacterized protein LAESUDRAFT_662552 [Laetiporus sulphureus 93-53]|uniref:Uncharacterized protein n=1 Tax=Laetiporus sulphureus 93-53 TaxID=1314785 RepID=A0A165C2Q7_9APHY|nr:uncharacterized protein LAESUDRAFT_662552 [Laetiporus sulphureus 93-53]KZT02094.1 hypothetical protein LAESUDRAFT_662552 [Laetiporus sulphureus 93-53]